MVKEIKQYKQKNALIKPYLKDMINNIKKSDTWKIQLRRAINFASKDTDEERAMYSESDNTKIMIK